MGAFFLLSFVPYFILHKNSFYCFQAEELGVPQSEVDMEILIYFFLSFWVTFWPSGSSFKNSFCLPSTNQCSYCILIVQNWNQSFVFKSNSSVHKFLLYVIVVCGIMSCWCLHEVLSKYNQKKSIIIKA